MPEWWEQQGYPGQYDTGQRIDNGGAVFETQPVDRAPMSNPWGSWSPPEGTQAPSDYWIPPEARFDDSPSGQINRQNPFADPGKPFAQVGATGGALYDPATGQSYETIGAGRSTTPAEADAAYKALLAKYGPDLTNDYLRRNQGDYTRGDSALASEWMGAGDGQSREQSEAMQRDPRMALSRPGGTSGTGQTWGGDNWFDDPATSQLETLIKNQLNGLTNPGANDPQSQLMEFLMTRFQELAGSNGYSPQELALLNTQALEPIEGLRKSAQQNELQRTARAGYLPTSGLTRLNQQDNDLQYDRMRTQANRDLAVQNVNERGNRLNQALQLGQTALNTQRGTNTNALQLSTLLQQLPVQALNQAMGVLGGSTSPESLMSLVNQMTQNQQQNQYYNQQRNSQLWSAIGQLIPELF